MPRVDFTTSSDADFVRGFVLATGFPVWDAAAVYGAGDVCDYGGKVWTGAVDSQGVTPGSDPAKWTATARPALDLTGSVLVYAIRKRASDAVALLMIRSDAVDPEASNIIVTDGGAGAFALTLSLYSQAVLRNAMAPGDYVHSLIRIRPDGLREERWRGAIDHQAGAAR